MFVLFFVCMHVCIKGGHLVTDQEYGGTQADPAALPWHARRQLLLEEMVAADAHILCLQARSEQSICCSSSSDECKRTCVSVQKRHMGKHLNDL